MLKKKEVQVGNASPIRKVYVAFHLSKVMSNIVVYAFEERLPLELSNTVMFKFGRYLADTLLSLPNKAFGLSEDFYASGKIVAVTNGESKEYDNLAVYANSLNVGDEDACNGEVELRSVCRCLVKSFKDNGIAAYPSEDKLISACLDGSAYEEVQPRLQRAFITAQERGLLDKVLFDAMSAYHLDFTSRFLQEREKDVPEGALLNYVVQMVPFSMAPPEIVASVYTAFLPLMLYANTKVSRPEFFTYRLECGRERLRQLSDGGIMGYSQESLELLTELIQTEPKSLVPHYTPRLLEYAKTEEASGVMAMAIMNNLLGPNDEEASILKFLIEAEE